MDAGPSSLEDVEGRRPRPFLRAHLGSTGLFWLSAAIVGIDLMVGVDSPYLLMVPLLVLIVPIVSLEKRLGFPVPLSPGVLFWMGHVLCYVVGGILWDLFGTVEVERITGGVAFDSWALGLQGASFGMLFFVAGMYAVSWLGLANRDAASPRRPDVKPWDWGRTWRLLVIYAFVGLGLAVLPKDSALRFLTGGISLHLGLLPFALMTLYVVLGSARWGTFLILVFAGVPAHLETIASGGREFVLNMGLFAVLGLCYWGARSRRMLLPLTFLAVGVVAVPAYTYIVGRYRSLEGIYRRETNLPARGLYEVLHETSLDLLNRPEFLQESYGFLGARLYEDRHIMLMDLVQSRAEEPGLVPMSELIYQYVPEVINPDKTAVRDRKRSERILQDEGLLSLEGSCPICLLGDAYYRLRYKGVAAVYFFHGACLIWVAAWLWKRGTGVTALAFFLLALPQLRMYSRDVFQLITSYTYGLPVALILSMLVLWMTGILGLRFARPGEPVVSAPEGR